MDYARTKFPDRKWKRWCGICFVHTDAQTRINTSAQIVVHILTLVIKLVKRNNKEAFRKVPWPFLYLEIGIISREKRKLLFFLGGMKKGKVVLLLA